MGTYGGWAGWLGSFVVIGCRSFWYGTGSLAGLGLGEIVIVGRRKLDDNNGRLQRGREEPDLRPEDRWRWRKKQTTLSVHPNFEYEG